MRALIVEFSGYGAASAAAFVLDVALLALLVDALGWHYLAAAAISFITGGLFLYLVSVRFIFRHRRIGNRALELSYFVALGSIGLIVNMIIMYALVEGLAIHFLGAKLVAAGCTLVTNFLLRRQLLFVRRYQ